MKTTAYSRIASVAGLALVLSGCFGEVLRQKTDLVAFDETAKVEDFVGDYQNWTIPERPGAGPSLSDAIWHGDPDLRNDRVRSIEVRLAGPKTLRVRALGFGGEEMKAGVFEEGRDFRISGGVVHIRTTPSAAAMGFYPMGPMAGVGVDSVSIGITRDGDAQQVNEGIGAGIFVVFPYTRNYAQGTRFRRIGGDRAR